MKTLRLLPVFVSIAFIAMAGEPSWIVREDSCFDSIMASRAKFQALEISAAEFPDLGTADYTVMMRIKTEKLQGTLFSWVPGKYKIGDPQVVCRLKGTTVQVASTDESAAETVTQTTGKPIEAERWHHVAVVGASPRKIYVDGKLCGASGSVRGPVLDDVLFILGGHPLKKQPMGFKGAMQDVRIYHRALGGDEIAAYVQSGKEPAADGLSRHWKFDGTLLDSAPGGYNAVYRPGDGPKPAKFADGALVFSGGAKGSYVAVDGTELRGSFAVLQKALGSDAARELEQLQRDMIWSSDWATALPQTIAERYARAGGFAPDQNLKQLHAQYRSDKLLADVMAGTERYQLDHAPAFIARANTSTELSAKLDALKKRAAWIDGETARKEFPAWASDAAALSREILMASPNSDFGEVAFVKRHSYQSNHYYTDYINGCEFFGGALCILDLKTGRDRELCPSLKKGIFGRLDVSYEGRRIVFAWKKDLGTGFYLYEVNTDGTGLRQLTFPPANEAALIEKYRVTNVYHHGTDDMNPCYLPDGGIAFVSTRCRTGTLCDGPDNFTGTTVFRIDGDGANMKQLSYGALSEATPAVMEDGRILYTRWEYVDKGAVSVKCLWAMRPDGSGSAEIYGNVIPLPPTLLCARQIPGEPNGFIMLGTPHCPNNGVGTVIRLDMNKNIRTREPMEYITKEIDVRSEGGYHYRENGGWITDRQGRGTLYADPYPLSRDLLLVGHKRPGPARLDPNAYGLYLLNGEGKTLYLHDAPGTSCWMPVPVRARKRPPVLPPAGDPKLAKKNLAVCIVTDVYHGMEGIQRGEAKYIRVNQQIPRFWSARRRWSGDVYDQQHAVVSKDASLGLKVQEGIVPIEEDGSAHFYVPANANVFFQVLDKNYMELQRERTFVNYLPGETRGCVGCHETPQEVPPPKKSTPLALRRPPSFPGPQPSEKSGKRTLHYERDVQPIFDKHCVSCHNPKKKEGDLDLSGIRTELFNVSYESLMPERRKDPNRDPMLLGPIIGENHKKTGFDDFDAETAYGTAEFSVEPDGYPTGNSVHYFPPKSIGSHTSKLVKLILEGHEDCKLSQEEFVRLVTWIDSNGQYYGSYYGRRNLEYKEHPNFRPDYSHAQAISMDAPLPEDQR